MRLTHNQALVAMVAVTLMWSTAGVVTRHLESAGRFEITFWRSFFTVASLLVILPLVHGRGVVRRMARAGHSFWLCGLCWGVMFTAFMLALTLTSVANVLVTMALGPLLTALVARLLIPGYRIAARTWCAIVAAGGGIAWMYGSQVAAGDVVGTLVAFAVPVAGALNWTLAERSNARGDAVDFVPAVLVGAAVSALVTLPLALPLRANLHDLGLLAFLGLTQLAIPCVLAVVCARVLSAPEISLLALLEVVFGIALAWVGAGEVPQPQVLGGGALVLGALAANEWIGWRQRR